MGDWKDSLANLLLSDTLPAGEEPKQQEPKAKKLPRVKLLLDKRKGKLATIVVGLENETDESVDALAKTLKNKLAVGGSARDGEILLQGDVREKAKTVLLTLGYRV